MPEFHVAPAGDDSWPGTSQRPFATIARARDAARATAGEVLIQLRAGVHPLTEPLTLTEADSGRDGHRIIYQAHGYGTQEQEEAVISGGRELTGWRIEDGVWLAEVGDLNTRQLYVDGRRAERAGVDGLPGNATRTATGYVTDSTEPLGWRSPGDVEFVYRGVYPWTEARCPVATVTGADPVTITMVQPAFGWAIDLYNSVYEGETMSGPGLPTRVENDASFLTEPGTFVLDRSRPGQHVVRYLPREGEDPERARVVAPVLEPLLRADGARDVSFRGLVFAEASWSQPSSGRGFLHYHGSGFYEGGQINRVPFGEGAWVTVPATPSAIPAGVMLTGSAGVEIEGCRFTRMGATGLGISGGERVTVRGCDFDLLSAGAVTVVDAAEVLIEENHVQHIGLDYSGSPGIAVTGTRDCAITHNEVADVPHCGIVVGPGAGSRVLHNHTVRTMGVLADGGGIYLAGPQGESAQNGAVVSGNVIEDTRTPYNFGLYTDYGAAWVTVENNVVVRADNTAILLVSPPLENVVYRGNFWDADPVGAAEPPEGVTYEDNRTLADEEALKAATAEIRDRAGLGRNRR
ncbi:right-handed parallel beta-helix repeat-containing protein [Micromonospora sp. KC606]|uniref:right-handed parallel beta-helix repeat-containing protein n=1 Tax=Micromonospora sp. KC606 TaxID=2530379 RepID=UPI001044917F|nr:right-handed parallel beta-helix repeat-containing protein [Micromonospora sp. KC606]TDC83890.1 right-handed parallel beta-helix repeat-containing protein [Micromonospora sp. KC606]